MPGPLDITPPVPVVALPSIPFGGSLITRYNGIALAGFGVPAIVAFASALAQTAANASVASYAVPAAADGSFEVSFVLSINSGATFSFQVECAYTDSASNARVQTMGAFTVGGAAVVWTFTNAAGNVEHQGIVTNIRVKAGTTITIRTQAAGTYTAVNYNIEGVIKQVG